MKKVLAGVTAGVLSLALAPAALADSPSSTQTHDCMFGTITFTGAQALWPPNHKFRPYNVTAVSDLGDLDNVALESVITNDEVVDGEELNGTGNTAVDAQNNPGMDMGQGTASVDQAVRSERSGRGDGRVYTFNVLAEFANGLEQCMAQFEVVVPHDQRDKVGKGKAALTKAARLRARR
jgi:hypothetical protein